MKFPIARFTPLSVSYIASIIILVTILITLTFTHIINKFLPYFILPLHDHFTKALVSKYPEVALPSPKGPTILDSNLKTQVVFKGLRYPTSMAFLGPDDMLVTEKDAGTIRRIVNGIEVQQPLLNVSVATSHHRGMLGIAVSPHPLYPLQLTISHQNLNNHMTHTTPTGVTATRYIFLYYTQAHIDDDIPRTFDSYLYRYELIGNNNKLVNPKLLLNLPATPGDIGNGGKVVIGPDNNVYITIGDVGIAHKTKAQNIQNGTEPDGTSGILRVNQDGQPIVPGILGNKFPLNLYYSYGIWNSFGLAFDPITRALWDTEIGLSFGDEINIVGPGFNSGYNKIDGIWLSGYNIGQTEEHHIAPLHPTDLVNFDGKGKYHPPQFTWFQKVVPTGIAFPNSNKIGNVYENDIFIADVKNGNIYHFKLNPQRTGLLLPKGSLADGVANSSGSLDQIIFGKGFGGIADLKVSPYDGYLYVLTFNQGTIYRVVPINK